MEPKPRFPVADSGWTACMNDETSRDQRKPIGVGRIVLFLAIYIVSWGPTSWIGDHFNWGNGFETGHIIAYYPVYMVYDHGPPAIKESMRWYLIVGAPKVP